MIKKLVKKTFNSLGYELLKRTNQANVAIDSQGKSFDDYLAMTEGMTTPKEALLLNRLAKEVTEGCIVEVGSYRGRSGVALGLGSREGSGVPVYAIDPHELFKGPLGGEFGPEDRAAFFRAMLETQCYKDVRLVNLRSTVVAPNWHQKVGLLWIDGDHSYEGVKSDFELWRPHLTESAIVAFDDSTDIEQGPYLLLQELYEKGHLRKIEIVDKVTVCAAI